MEVFGMVERMGIVNDPWSRYRVLRLDVVPTARKVNGLGTAGLV